jgi:hypothetical protein
MGNRLRRKILGSISRYGLDPDDEVEVEHILHENEQMSAREAALRELANKYGEELERAENGDYCLVKYRQPIGHSFKTLEEAESWARGWYLGVELPNVNADSGELSF